MSLFFHLTHFRELGQKYRNNFVRFLVQLKTLNFAFEINSSQESVRGRLFILGDQNFSRIHGTMTLSYGIWFYRCPWHVLNQLLTWPYELKWFLCGHFYEKSVSASETDILLKLTPPNLKGSDFWYFYLANTRHPLLRWN